MYPRPFKLRWCSAVRIVGKNLRFHYNPSIRPAPRLTPKQVRTISVWGEGRQFDIARMTIGIVGVGSVGSAVVDILARIGVGHIVIMDYDRIKPHNLDRMPGATGSDINKMKVDVVEKNAKSASTGSKFAIEKYEYSIVEENGYRKALDCDVLFSCVDRPWPRQVLNHISYTCLIPVIDGGISFRIDNRSQKLIHGMFRAQTVGPERACMRCMNVYDSGQVQMDRDGALNDPKYIERLNPAQSSALLARQNIMPFVYGLACVETTQFVELVTNLGNAGDLGQQPYNYHTGEIRPIHSSCVEECEYVQWTALGHNKPPALGIDKSRQREVNRKN